MQPYDRGQLPATSLTDALVVALKLGATHFAKHRSQDQTLLSVSFFASPTPDEHGLLREVAVWLPIMEVVQHTGRPFAFEYIGRQYSRLEAV